MDCEEVKRQEVRTRSRHLLALVVGRDGNIDEAERRVRVTESDGGDVHEGGLVKGLRVRARVGDDEEAGLLELLLDLVGEGTGSVATSHVVGAGVLTELEHRTLTVRTSRDDANCTQVRTSSSPRSSSYRRQETVGAALPDVWHHLVVQVLRAEMHVGRKHLRPVIIGGSERRWEAGVRLQENACQKAEQEAGDREIIPGRLPDTRDTTSNSRRARQTSA
eukprot:733969-Hanusia_phi.AAC.1